MNRFWPIVRAFVVALLATAFMAALRHFVFVPFFGFNPPALPYLLAILLAAWLGGSKSGYFATAINALLLTFVFSGSIAFQLPLLSNQVRLFLFVVIGGSISRGIEALRASRQRLEERQRELEKEVIERKHAEDIIRASESRLRAIMDNTSAVIYLKDSQGRYLTVNKRYEELFNVTQEQIAGKTDADIFPGEIAAKLQTNDRQVRDTGQSFEFEEVVPHADGPHTYVSVKFPVLDAMGQITAVGGVSTDISDRKKAADALEAEQELLRHTIEVQDQERQLVAYEIHDGLVQYATGALMQLESTRPLEKTPALGRQIENVIGILRKTVNEGRRIINGIHTTILDDCGVVAAVQQLIEDEDRAHVQIEFIKDESLGRMAPSIELALYHITQEALTNAHKHSQSNRVRIGLDRREDCVHLEIRDWGIGFTPPANSKEIHGLRGMTERARIAGGKCTVQNAPDKGTLVLVDLPYVSRS